MNNTDIMNKPIVLQLNANWMPIGYKTLKEAIIAMTSDGESPAAVSLDIKYTKNEDGSYDFGSPEYMNPLSWEDWITSDLPIREYDFVIHSARLEFRAPTVIIAPGYRKMPMKKSRPTKFNVYERDGGVCQYTGKKLTRTEGNIDHVIPQSKGGKSSWENQVFCDKNVNSKKGSKSLADCGYELLKEPKAPPELPVSSTIRDIKHPTWTTFLTNPKL